MRFMSQDSSVGIAIDYGMESHGLIPGSFKRFISTLEHPDRFWGSPSLLYNGYHGLLPGWVG
jgi:hypothetical protein